MKAINSCDIEIGNSDISVKLYSAIEGETHLKQISACCNSAVKYNRICESCNKVLEWGEIKKAIDTGESLKEIDADSLKSENGNLKVLGILQDESEEAGILKDGSVWFIGFDFDKKNKSKTQRNLMKFSYLRAVLSKVNESLIGLISIRGKEHIVILKPYFNALVGLGLYHFDRIRDIKEISGYSENFNCDEETLKQMALNFCGKESISIKNIENTRNKLIEQQLTKEEMGDKLNYAKKEENPLEICNF
jgi:non-homologous end joining protein Ku